MKRLSGHEVFLLLSLALICFCSCTTNAYKFLGILPTGARSHHIVGSALFKGLAKQGHEVTVISPFPQKKPLKNYHDITAKAAMESMKVSQDNLLKTVERSVVANILEFYNMGIRFTEETLDEPSVQTLINSNQTFDAVICEVFLSEALFGLAEHFKVPLIGLGTFGAISWNTDMVGSPSPPSYVPNAFLPFTERMSLPQRIGNLALLTFERLYMDYYYLPRQEAVYKRIFPNNKRSMYEVRKNTALVLLNQHVSLSFARPYMPNQIEVGGMHINRQRTPLPENIQKFLDEAKNGAIYFSMGSNIKSKNLPIEKREAILNTFRSLKQRVLWKFEDVNLEGKPDNVFISDWFPQDDILAHKNVRAFITHGGLLSTTESIYHGKPFIGIPVFGDQFLNMARAEGYGYGIQVGYLELTEEKLKSAISRILNEPSYIKNVREVSARYRDQDQNPLDRAIYWVEHVARHNGAEYLHCAGLDLNFIQYHNIDAMVILFGGLALVLGTILWIIIAVLRAVKCWLVGSNKKPKKD